MSLGRRVLGQPYIWPRTLGKEDILENVLYIFTWYATPDEKTCPVCGGGPDGLDGYSWVLDHVPDQLVHPRWGPVWDIRANYSLVHIRFPWLHGDCRCTTDAEPEIKIGGVNVRIEEVEFRVHSINQSLIGIQRDLVAAERITLGLMTGNLTGQGIFYTGQRLVRRYAPTAGDIAQQTLNPLYYGMVGGPLVGRGGQLLAAVTPFIEPALLAAAIALPLIGALGDVYEDMMRPVTQAQAFRQVETARERTIAWETKYGKR